MSEKNPKNLYRKALEFGVKRLHKGFDYHQTDDVVVEQIDAVKVIRTYFNYTVDKNDKNIN